ncbi:hypothetical protein BHM03_00019711 [Ensete ventricosum]|nr:hypothetical protein BHM03_00019711 [Ensete ventricosum]
MFMFSRNEKPKIFIGLNSPRSSCRDRPVIPALEAAARRSETSASIARKRVALEAADQGSVGYLKKLRAFHLELHEHLAPGEIRGGVGAEEEEGRVAEGKAGLDEPPPQVPSRTSDQNSILCLRRHHALPLRWEEEKEKEKDPPVQRPPTKKGGEKKGGGKARRGDQSDRLPSPEGGVEAIVEEGKESDGDGEGSGGDRHSGDGEVPEERGAPRFEIHSFGP